MLSFRLATVKDIPKLIEFDSKAQSKTYAAYLTTEEWLKEMQESEVFVIQDELFGNTSGWTPVGMFTVQKKGLDHIYIGGLVVDPAHRRKGYAEGAMLHIISKFSEAKRLDLVTHPKNSSAVMLYLKLGFVIESWKDNYYGDGEPRIVLALTRE